MAALLAKVYSRRTIVGSVSMWGTLHVEQPSGKVVGWIVDTWTDAGINSPLPPRMYWVPRSDNKSGIRTSLVQSTRPGSHM